MCVQPSILKVLNGAGLTALLVQLCISTQKKTLLIFVNIIIICLVFLLF